MDQETIRELKRIEAEISLLHREDRLLRERISTATGDVSSEFYVQGSLNGILSVGAGLSGGGTFPGSVTISLTTPGSLSVSSTNSASGNHTHVVTSSSNPGAAASILASSASGHLQLVRLGAGMAPSSPITAAGYMYAEGDGVSCGYLSYRYTGDGLPPYWSSRKARGSVGSPAIVQDGDFLLDINVHGYDGSDWEHSGNIYFQVSGTPGAGDIPTRMLVYLSKAGVGTPGLAMLLSDAANLSVYGESHLFGNPGTNGAQVRIYGKTTGNATGGQLVLDTADDHDSTIEYYVVESDEDDMRIWPSTASWVNKFTAEGQFQISATGSGAGILIGGDAQWYRSAANMLSTPDNVTIETRCFGFLKAQNEDGLVGNGPVEYGEVVAVGGIMEIAPAAALYEAVTIN